MINVMRCAALFHLICMPFLIDGMDGIDEIVYRTTTVEIANVGHQRVHKKRISAYKEQRRIGFVNYSYSQDRIFPFDGGRKKSYFYYKRILNTLSPINKKSGMVFDCFVYGKYHHSPENLGESLVMLALKKLQEKGISLALVKSLDDVNVYEKTDVPEYSAVFLKNKPQK